MKNKLSTKQGFTIIEVVLVLAIAGLIFLMVFVAFPALQRNQRDTQRRQDYADLGAAVISAATNSNGQYPSNTTVQAIRVGNNGNNPEGAAYSITAYSGSYTSPTSNPSGTNWIIVAQKSSCSGDKASYNNSTKTAKDFVIYGYLDGGTYCREFSI